jgi:cobalt-zinc-cadmium efflux system membrane fusion protein
MVNTPVSGIVLQRRVGVGQNIVSQTNGGSTSAFLIGNVAKVWLLANAREVDAPLIHLGDPVEVSVPAYPGRVFHARISYVGASIDPTTHRLPVRAEVDNPDGMLKPEMFASFRIITGADESSPSVPQEAVVFEGNTAHVWVARLEDKSILLRQIRVGRSSDGMLQVIDGLRGGEHVVTRGALFIDRAAAD